MKHLLAFLIICSIISQKTANACFIVKKFHVQVKDNLPEGSPKLRIHCAGGGDDLRPDDDLSHGQQFNFEFCPTIRSHYYCEVWWLDTGKYKAFDVVNVKAPTAHCGPRNCYYEVQENGFYYSLDWPVDPNNLIKFADW